MNKLLIAALMMMLKDCQSVLEGYDELNQNRDGDKSDTEQAKQGVDQAIQALTRLYDKD